MGIDKPKEEVIGPVTAIRQSSLYKVEPCKDEKTPNFIVETMRYYDDTGNSRFVTNKPRMPTESELNRSRFLENKEIISGEVDDFKLSKDVTKNDVLKFSCVGDRHSRTEMRKYCIEILTRMSNLNYPRIRITTQDIANYCNHKHLL